MLADKIYRNRDNLAFCKEHNIRFSGPALGRPKKEEQPNKKQNYMDECERVEVERRFSLAKRKCNLGLAAARLMDTAYHCIAMFVVVLNLRKLMLSLYAIIKFLLEWINFKKVLLVQQSLNDFFIISASALVRDVCVSSGNVHSFLTT